MNVGIKKLKGMEEQISIMDSESSWGICKKAINDHRMDSVSIQLENFKISSYELRIKNLWENHGNASWFLIDRIANREVPIVDSASFIYTFHVTAENLSEIQNRFLLIQKPIQILSVNDVNLSGHISDKNLHHLHIHSRSWEDILEISIEKSLNGRDYQLLNTWKNRIEFFNLDSIKYSYRTNEPSVFYRLKMKDYSSNNHYGKILIFRNAEKFSKLSALKKGDDILVQLDADQSGAGELLLYDCNGSRVKGLKINYLGGRNQFNINNISTLSQGIYRVVLYRDTGEKMHTSLNLF
jgi:hypothetical protein